jgi:hypothetical protein
MRRRMVMVLTVLAVCALIFVPVVSASSLAALAWSRYDVDIQVNTNGTLTVTEIQTIQFTGGQSYRKGFAVIPQARGSIHDVKVWEGPQAYTPSGSQQPYPPTANSIHTFNLQYTVRDGLLYYPDQGYDRLQWKAIPSDHDYPIVASRVTVKLPGGAPILNAPDGKALVGVAFGDPASASVGSDRTTATFESIGALSPGQGIEIRVDFQYGAVAGSPPPWQTTYDLQDRYKPLIDLASLGLAALIAIGGTLLVFLRWYTKGKDPQTGLAAEYVADPPGDLPPGVVGTLLDERADIQDILATVIDLARRGYLTMEEQQTPGFMGIGMSRDFIFRRKADADLSQLRGYERLVLDRVVPSGERKLSELKNKFYQYIGEISTGLYKEVVKEKLFPVRPDSVRSRWGCGGVGLLVVAIGGGILVGGLLADITWAVILPFIALGLVGIVVSISGSFMPVKTRQGAEAASAWLAFKRYLSNLERYTKVQEATDQFDKYLPYAIAFGVERSWINRFARVDTVPIPGWYFPYGWGRPYYQGHGGTTMSSGAGQGGLNMPSVQGMSDGLAGSLQGMSAGLSSMLNSAASTFRSVPQSSGRGGGGWGGGGFSGGGGGGGGSRGFG